MFIVFVGTVTLPLVPPFTKPIVADPAAVVQLFALNVTVTVLLQVKLVVPAIKFDAIVTVAVSGVVSVQFGFIVYPVGLEAVKVVAPLYNVPVTPFASVVHPF